jgi:hypothetical protein
MGEALFRDDPAARGWMPDVADVVYPGREDAPRYFSADGVNPNDKLAIMHNNGFATLPYGSGRVPGDTVVTLADYSGGASQALRDGVTRSNI